MTRDDAAGDLLPFLRRIWEEGDVRELRGPKYAGLRTASGYFDSPEHMATAAASWGGKANLYITVNPVDPALLARAVNRIDPSASKTTADANVVRRDWLPVDIDPVRPAGVSATEAELRAAGEVSRRVRAYLAEQGWPAPMVLMSGNGIWLLLRIALHNDDESTRLVRAFLEHLDAKFSTATVKIDTTVHNAARIGPLVGTLKMKGDSTADRPHRVARLLDPGSEPDEGVSPEQLEALVPVMPAGNGVHADGDGSMPAGWVKDWLKRANVAYREQPPDPQGIVWYRLAECPWHPDDDLGGDCGVGERADRKATGHCFHARGTGKGWADFRDALGLKGAPPATFRGEGPDSGASAPVAASTRKLLTFRTAREIALATPVSVPWAALPFLAFGAMTELTGRPKAAGKSTWTAHLARSILDGQPFLGQPTERGPIVMLTEQGDTSLRELLARVGLLERDDLLLLTWSEAAGTPWPDVLRAAEGEAHRIGSRIVLVDTLPQFAGLRGDAENDAGAALEAVEPLQALTAKGFAVLVNRHDRKGGGEVGESARGSGAFTGAVDIVLALSRDSHDLRPTMRRLLCLSRFDETPTDLMLELVDGQYLALGAIEAVKANALRDALLALLPANGEDPIAPADLTEAAGKDETTIKQALNAMLAESASRVTRYGGGRKGDPYRWSRSGQDAPEFAGAPLRGRALSAGIPWPILLRAPGSI